MAAWPSLPPTLAGALLMGTAACGMAVDTIIARMVVQEVHPTVLVFFRNLFSLMIMAPWLWRMRHSVFRTSRLTLHIVRNLLKLGALITFFTAVGLMPLAGVTAIQFAMPLFAAAGAVLFLGEAPSRRRTLSTLVGFMGVLLIIRPGVETITIGAFAAVASAILQAGVGLMVKYLGRFDPPNTIVALTLVLSLPLSLLPALFFWTTPALPMLGLIAIQGGIGVIAQICITRGMRKADASLMMPIDFVRLPLVALIAYLAFGEVPDSWTWAGAAVVFVSLLTLLGLGQRRRSSVETALPPR